MVEVHEIEESLVDWIGYDELVRFQAGLGDEFSSSNAFEAGKLAMNMDGEWRVAFIKAEHPTLQYGTAPLPVDDAHHALYARATSTAPIIGIPKNGKHAKEASISSSTWRRTTTRSRSSRTGSATFLDALLAQLEGIDPGHALLDVSEDLRQRAFGDVADHSVRCLVHESRRRLHDEVAGGEG